MSSNRHEKNYTKKGREGQFAKGVFTKESIMRQQFVLQIIRPTGLTLLNVTYFLKIQITINVSVEEPYLFHPQMLY